MKILLVAPVTEHKIRRYRSLRIPQLSLNILASLTPKDIEVTLVEELVEDIDFTRKYDLVGITLMTAQAKRAYEIAERFRERGSKVVLGGIHPTVMPEEALRHADSVVIGEAEECWGRLITDFRNGGLKRVYKQSEPDMSRFPLPKRDGYRRENLFNFVPVLTTRGCPYDCEFCSVTDLYGRRIRHLPVEKVVADIKASSGKRFIFLDDNIIGDRKYAKKLFRAIIPLKIKWFGQASISLLVKDKELMRLAAKSGCRALFLGIESVSSNNTKKMKKSFCQIQDCEEAIKVIRKYGIYFHASVVFGFDEDTTLVFKEMVDFLINNKIPSATFNILTPYPGTRLYERLKSERRLLTEDWCRYNHATVVYQPRNMTPEQLDRGRIWALKRFYSRRLVFRRFFQNLRHPLFYLMVSLGYRKYVKGIDEATAHRGDIGF